MPTAADDPPTMRSHLPRGPESRFGKSAASPGRIRVLIVDDHAVVADAIEAYLTVCGEPFTVDKATSVPQALAIADCCPDLGLVLLDLHIPLMDGLAGLRLLRERRPELPIAIFSGDISPRAHDAALQAGANGFIPKTLSGAGLLSAIRHILAGDIYVPEELGLLEVQAGTTSTLTNRERQVLKALLEGRANKDIAAAIGVTPAAVALRLTGIYRKLNVGSRAQAIRRAFELGLYPDRRRV